MLAADGVRERSRCGCGIASMALPGPSGDPEEVMGGLAAIGVSGLCITSPVVFGDAGRRGAAGPARRIVVRTGHGVLLLPPRSARLCGAARRASRRALVLYGPV